MSARAWGLVGLVLLLDVGACVGLLAAQQVRVEVALEGPGSVTIDDGWLRTLLVVGDRAPLRVDVVHADGGVVALTALRTLQTTALSDPTQFEHEGDFVPGEQSAWTSREPGAALHFTGNLTGFTAVAQCGPEAGVVCLRSSTSDVGCVELSGCQGTKELTVPPARTLHHTLVPLWRSHAHLNATTTSVRWVRWWRGGTLLGEHVGRLPEHGLDLELPSLPRHVAAFAGTAVGQLALVLALVLVLALLGSALVTPLVQRLSSLEAVLLALFVGEGLASNLVTSLTFVFRLQLSAALVLGVGLTLAVVQLARGGAARWRQVFTATSVDERRLLLALAVVSVVASVALFFPAVVFPGWYLGHGLTDSMEYTAWASLVREAPIDPLVGATRHEDYVRLSLTSLLSGVDTTHAFALQAWRAWLVWPFVVFALLRRLTRDASLAVVGAAVAANANGFVELFTQCYLPHFEVLFLGVAAAWAGAWFFDEGHQRAAGEPRRLAEVVLGAVFAAAVGLYPYQAFSVVAFGLVSLATRNRARLASLAVVVLVTVLVVNVNLGVLLGLESDTLQYRDRLNGIARFVVFPWFDSPQLAVVLAGFLDFSQLELGAPFLFSELFAAMPRQHERALAVVNATSTLPGVLTAAWLALVVMSLGWVVLGRRRQPSAWLLPLSVLMPVALAAKLMQSGDVYFWVKSLMSFASLVVPAAVGCLAWAALSRRGWLALPASALVGLFVFGWLRAAAFDQVTQYLDRQSNVSDGARNHLPVYEQSLVAFERLVEGVPAPKRFVFVDRLSDSFRSDDDIVLYNKVLTLLEGHQVRYGSGESRRYTRIRPVEYRGDEPLRSFDFAVQFDVCAELSVPSTVVLDEHFFCVRRLEPTRP